MSVKLQLFSLTLQFKHMFLGALKNRLIETFFLSTGNPQQVLWRNIKE